MEEKTFTIRQLYNAVRNEESHKDFCRSVYGPESEEYDLAVSWYCSAETLFYAVTGMYYPEYKKEVGDDI